MTLCDDDDDAASDEIEICTSSSSNPPKNFIFIVESVSVRSGEMCVVC